MTNRSVVDPAGLGSLLDFMRAMWAVDHELQAVSKRMRRSLGVTGPQRLALRIVGQRPGMSAGELSALLHLHPSTLTGILERLVRAGFLSRQSTVGDRRRLQLKLTPKGRALNEETEGTVESAVQEVLRDQPPARVAAARAVLAAIASALERAQPMRRRARSGRRGRRDRGKHPIGTSPRGTRRIRRA